MAYKEEHVTLEDVEQRIAEYPYALVYSMSDLYFGKVADMGKIDWAECLEARFFSKEEELHLFRDEDQLEGVIIGDMEDADVIVRIYDLDKRWSGSYGKTLQVKEYLGADEDGQVYVAATRLMA